ncbi:SDR family NAD(P)-dependent oxidoreductase [Microbacterium sp. No. 7]|uniref:SDR family NAD(P)-dependent oxidoreductase n=1 Tax=Microbacterium sp. No. 7 TaxID=1714373 RepID=UPI0006ECF6E2|nr:SDR family oxidoreductase [Microbacterium sp. No. 7]ALJ18856.1 hypothetical protein AOA12_02585 [Microbacterium sp. No. 7]
MAEYIEETPDYPTLMRMDGRHVVVLGAGQGIGRQTAVGAASLGARVTCVDLDRERAAAVAAQVGGIALSGDATVRDDMQRIVDDAVAAHGPVHGVADIIGLAQWGSIDAIDDDNWYRTLDLNLRHAFLALQLCSRAMTEGGSMAFVGSVSGFRSAPHHAAYGAAKAGLMNLIGTAAVELGPDIRVNVVAPGQTVTPRQAVRHAEPGYYEERARLHPLGRVGRPCDIASALLFFLSDLSSWVTGQTLVVDGGAGRNYQYPS